MHDNIYTICGIMCGIIIAIFGGLAIIFYCLENKTIKGDINEDDNTSNV